MEANRKRAKVHMLPTDRSYLTISGGKLSYDDVDYAESGFIKPQHLYITTDEEIKEGDCYIHPDATVPQNDFNHVYVDCRKIIATTDPKLLKPQIKQVNWIGSERIWSLPQIPQSFIEEYCKAGGIDNVMVEYECLTSTNTIVLDFSKVTADEAIKSDRKCIESRVKTDSNNCIIMHPVVEKMYSKEELLGLTMGNSNIIDWINENL